MTQICTDDYALLLKGKLGSGRRKDMGDLFLLGEGIIALIGMVTPEHIVDKVRVSKG